MRRRVAGWLATKGEPGAINFAFDECSTDAMAWLSAVLQPERMSCGGGGNEMEATCEQVGFEEEVESDGVEVCP